jgi:heat shock protein HtpX
MKRIGLFVLTNLVVLVTLSVTAHLLGLNRHLDAHGLDLSRLLGFAAVFGFGGALISLALSKWTAKMAVGARVIATPATATEAWLVETVRRHASAAGIGMPEVAIFDADEINAFATGMRRNQALVAVSSGLLARMPRNEADAVLAHEIAHVANGDMVTLALVQGVLNTFVIFIARVAGWLVDRVVLRNQNAVGPAYYVTFFVLEVVLGLLASLVVMHVSRQREFRADHGGAALAGRHNMVAALERLARTQEVPALPGQMAAFGIAGRGAGNWRRWFATYPPLAERIARLRADTVGQNAQEGLEG